jgi:hypothetical protein
MIAFHATTVSPFAFAQNRPSGQKDCAFQASSPKTFGPVARPAFFLSRGWSKGSLLLGAPTITSFWRGAAGKTGKASQSKGDRALPLSPFFFFPM